MAGVARMAGGGASRGARLRAHWGSAVSAPPASSAAPASPPAREAYWSYNLLDHRDKRALPGRSSRSFRPFPRQQKAAGTAPCDFLEAGRHRLVRRGDEPCGSAPEVSERLGNHLFRVTRVNEHPVGECVKTLAVPLVQGAQGIRLTARHAVQEMSVRNRGRVVGHNVMKTAETGAR